MIKKSNYRSMVNMTIMHDVFGNNQAAILEFLQSFAEITLKLLKKTEHAISEKNQTMAMDCLHQLKGSVSTIGFKQMVDLSEKAEEKITESDWNSAQQLHRDMEDILKKFQVEMSTDLK